MGAGQKAVGVRAKDWRLKHLRNVGPSLGKYHKRHADERTTFLAHSEGGSNQFYEGTVGEDYLVELVNLIGEEYFDGEEVYVHSKTSGEKVAMPITANA